MQLEPQPDGAALDRPGYGAAEVVLVGIGYIVTHRLPDIELGGVEICTLSQAKEELSVPLMDSFRIRRLVEPLERVLADGVEHAKAAAVPPPEEVLLDE
jgi:hypothetical protein